MTQTYGHNDAVRVQQVLTALLPPSVSSSVQVLGGGLTLGIALCGPKACRTFEFSSKISEADLLTLAKSWATGDFVVPDSPKDQTLIARSSPILEITTREAFFTWFKPAKQGQRIIYFKGRLAQFRQDSTKRIVTLTGLADNARPSRPRPTSERIELMQLNEQTYLLNEIGRLHSMGKIELTQGNMPNDAGTVYYATKK